MAAESQQAPLKKDLWNDLFSEEKNILKPEMIEELYHPTIRSIKIVRYTSATVTEEITIESVYPFYTIHDLKLAIYKKKDEDGVHPQEDWNLWDKMLEQGATVASLKEGLLFYRRHRENFLKYSH
jgi:hypothetical protein